MECRVLKSGSCEITQGYSSNHKGVDIVGAGYTLQWEVAHTDGEVVEVVNNCNYNTYPNGDHIYGNYVKIRHDNGYYTLYGHIAYGTVKVSKGQRVSRGDTLGYMGNTGYSNGGHLHWEVRNPSDERINPEPYLNADLPNIPKPSPLKHKIGEKVKINKVYVSSESVNPLTPIITEGVITKIIDGARNPYLLDDGNIGWVNDDCIIEDTPVDYKKLYEEELEKNKILEEKINKAIKDLS